MNTKEKLIMALIILGVVGAGLFAINQFFAWHYKAEFLMQPCGLCVKLNPEFTRCTPITESYDFGNLNFNSSALKQ